MSPLRRVALIVALTLAAWVTMRAWMSLGLPLLRWLGNEALVEPVIRVCILATWLLPLLFAPRLRDIGALHLRRTWTVLLILPFVFANVTGFYGIPWDQMEIVASIVGSAMLVGAVEELIFRGYAFRGSAESHPRLVIVVSSLCFALLHLTNLRVSAADEVVFQIGTAFLSGLGFGIIRVVSGSLGWCVLLHGLVDATAGFTVPHLDGMRAHLRALFAGASLVLPIVALFTHPRLRGAAEQDSRAARASLSLGRMTLLLFLAALLGSLLDLSMDTPWPSGFAAWVGGSLGSASVLFVAAMLVAIFLRGWRGFFAGLIVIAVLTSLLASSALQRRGEGRQPPAASPAGGGPR